MFAVCWNVLEISLTFVLNFQAFETFSINAGTLTSIMEYIHVEI